MSTSILFCFPDMYLEFLSCFKETKIKFKLNFNLFHRTYFLHEWKNDGKNT